MRQFSILEDPALPPLLGSGRHHVYLTRAGGSRPDAMRLYTWNIAVSGDGFWVALLANRYHQRLWVATMEAAFPHLQGTRRALHTKLERLRMLRNRVAHHEPVFARDLSADHALILEVLDSIDPTVKHWVGEYSRVPHLLECRDDMVAGYWPMTF